MIISKGDRFISQRSIEGDDSERQRIKQELYSTTFSTPQKKSKRDEAGQDDNGNQQQNDKQDDLQNEEESKKTYRALLQNQVLGIDNEQLLHEIHNHEDYIYQQQTYSQIQQNAENMDLAADGFQSSPQRGGGMDNNSPGAGGSPLQYRVNNYMYNGAGQVNSDLACKNLGNTDLSPFNTKFTVLRFSEQKSNKSNGKGGKGSSLRPFELTPDEAQLQNPSENVVMQSAAVSQFSCGSSSNASANYAGGISNLAAGTQIKPMSTSSGSMSGIPNDPIPSLMKKVSIMSENLNPIQEERSFGLDDDDDYFRTTRPPFSGFDQEKLIVPKTKQRQIPKVPYKVLDAPSLKDDYYLNLVDWSEQNDLCVGLSNCVYIWSATSSKVTKLHDLGDTDEVTSVSWARRGTHLSVGTHSGIVQVWDLQAQKLVRNFEGHQGRVGALSWSSNILSSGSKDRAIHNHDLRDKASSVTQLLGHRQEVCGLKWSHDDMQLASGGNDNKLMVWSAQARSGSEPLWKFSSHQAAVKALAWSPHQKGLLVSGGGTADRCIRFWNTIHGFETQCVQTDSQVCNLMFSKNNNELVSTHGYSDNAIVVWKYPTMRKLSTLTGHNLRVLYLAMSPDGESIVTGAGDETLRFWKVFPKQAKIKMQGSLIENSAFVIR